MQIMSEMVVMRSSRRMKEFVMLVKSRLLKSKGMKLLSGIFPFNVHESS
jgi:hypothetical protein